ncbi:MAG TPA: PAS domain S-box protein [Candidatus Hydrogenedens sp.]|nr:PAS domain S-box protein [Candidatus Hydrogenedens sp.]
MEIEEFLKKTKEELVKEIFYWKSQAEEIKNILTGKGKKYYTLSDLQPLFQSMTAIDTAVYVSDMDTYEIFAANEYVRNFLKDEIIGKKCYEVLQVGQTSPCSFCTNDRLLNSKGEPNPPYVWTFQNTKTGSFFQCIDFAIPWENGKMVRIEVAINIDRLVNIQKDRDTQISLTKTIIESIPQAVFWKDRNGVFLGCNHQFAKDANCSSPEEVIGKTDYDLPWTKEESASFREIDRRIMESGEPLLNFEEKHTRASGEVRWLYVSKVPLRDRDGNIIGVLGTYGDITEMKRAQEIIKYNEQLLNSIMQTTPFGVIFVRNQVIEWCNDRICQVLGYSKEEMIGKSTRTYYETEEEFNRVGKELYKDLVGYNTSWVETKWKSKNGEWIDIRINAALRNPQCPEDGIVAGIIDIREQKKFEQQREQMQERIHQLQKIQSLETLAGGVAHDFNNLLMAMIGSAELALHEVPEISVARGYLNSIIIAGKKGSELAQQMLSYAGRKKLLTNRVNLNKMIGEMVQIIQSSISKKVVLKLDLAEQIPLVEGDITQLSQIIMNLVINANEAIGNKSGVIIIRTSASLCDSKYLDTLFLPGELKEGLYVVIEVIDTGCGMDEETKKHIFEPFYTTKFTGRGLGLSSVLGIIKSHHGGIKLYSEKGKGTAFKIFLPAIEWMEEKDTAFTEEKKELRYEGKFILAEDEDTVRAITQRMLEYLGFEVLAAVDGREAIQLFKEHKDDIKCVLLDLTMPHVDGIEACIEMKKIKKEIPIILTSGYPHEQIATKTNIELFSNYVQKPFRFDGLKEIIQQVLSK